MAKKTVKKTKAEKKSKLENVKSVETSPVKELPETSVDTNIPVREVREVEVHNSKIVKDEVKTEVVEQPVPTKHVTIVPHETVPPPTVVRKGATVTRIAYQVKRLRDAENAAKNIKMRRRGRK